MGNMETPLASLSLTHVNYNPDDPVSYFAALLALVPQALCIIYVTLIWASREVEILLMFAGQMACEALNFLLKRVIRQERPPRMNGKGYGMPSSHSQFVGFFALSVTLFLLVRHVPDPALNHSPASFGQRVKLSVVVGFGAATVAVSRVYLTYHTAEQVLAGFVAGIAFAVVWFLFSSYLRTAGWIDQAVDTALARSLRMRDLLVGEDLAEGGWQRWEDVRQRGIRTGSKAREKSH